MTVKDKTENACCVFTNVFILFHFDPSNCRENTVARGKV